MFILVDSQSTSLKIYNETYFGWILSCNEVNTGFKFNIWGMWYFFVVVNDDLMFSLLLTLKGFQETSKVSKAALKLANVKEDTWTLNSIDFCIF